MGIIKPMETPPFSKSYYYSQFLGFLGNSVWKFSTGAPLPPVIFPHEIFKPKPTQKTVDGTSRLHYCPFLMLYLFGASSHVARA